MSNITLAIPEALHAEMKQFSEVRWSEVARRAIAEEVEKRKMIEKIAKKSKLTKKDVEEFSKILKAKAAKRFAEDAGHRL